MSISISGDGTFTGVSTNYSFDKSVSVGGTVTYEDVTNVDSIGVVTARSRLDVGVGGTVLTTTLAGRIGIGTEIPTALVEIRGDDFVKITRNSKELSLNANYSGQDVKAQIQVGAGMSLAFATNGDNERVVIKSNGEAVVNTKITVGNSYTGGEIFKLMKNSGTSYLAHYNGATAHGFMGYASELVTGGSGTDYALRATNNLLFATDGANERMRIDTDGHIICGTTTLNNYGTVNAYSNDQTPGLRCVSGSSMNTGSAVLAVDKHQNINTTSQTFMIFTINEQNTGSGKITANGASQAAFGTFSDRRLKTNIVDIPSQYENIRRLRPVEFDYIESEGGGHQTSFIAQEFEEVYPDGIGEREDGMKTLTGWGKTEAILVKALQEAIDKIETLEAQVAELQGN